MFKGFYVGYISIYYIVYFEDRSAFERGDFRAMGFKWDGDDDTPCILISKKHIPTVSVKDAYDLPLEVTSQRFPCGMILNTFLSTMLLTFAVNSFSKLYEMLIDTVIDYNKFIQEACYIVYEHTPEWQYITLLRFLYNKVLKRLCAYGLDENFAYEALECVLERRGTTISSKKKSKRATYPSNDDYYVELGDANFKDASELRVVDTKYKKEIIDYLHGKNRKEMDTVVDELCSAILDTINTSEYKVSVSTIKCSDLSRNSVFYNILEDLPRQLVFGVSPYVESCSMPSLECLVSSCPYEDVDVFMHNIIQHAIVDAENIKEDKTIRVYYNLDDCFIINGDNNLIYSLDSGIIDQIANYIRYAFGCVIYREVHNMVFVLEIHEIIKGNMKPENIVVSVKDNKYILGEYKV